MLGRARGRCSARRSLVRPPARRLLRRRHSKLPIFLFYLPFCARLRPGIRLERGLIYAILRISNRFLQHGLKALGQGPCFFAEINKQKTFVFNGENANCFFRHFQDFQAL
jgi:hypothetical protein